MFHFLLCSTGPKIYCKFDEFVSTCLRCLRVLGALLAFVPTCLKLLRAYVPSFFTCLSACILNVPIYIFLTYVPSRLKLFLRALVFHVLTCLQPPKQYIEDHFYTSYCCFSLDYLTFHSIENPKTNSYF